MKEHHMHLHPEPFEAVKRGEKRIETRVFDEKRRNVKVGDSIEFTNRETNEVITVHIESIHIFADFGGLYDHFSHEFPGLDRESFITSYDPWYPREEVEKWGAIAFCFTGDAD